MGVQHQNVACNRAKLVAAPLGARAFLDRGRLARSFFREAKLKTRAGRPRSQDPTSPAMTPSGAASRFAPVAVALIFQISPDQEFPRWNEFPGYHRVVAANRMNRNIRYVSQGDAIRFRLEISLGPV